MNKKQGKETVYHYNAEKDLPPLSAKRTLMFFGPLLVLLGTLVCFAARKEYRDRQQEKTRAVAEAATDARLIAMKDSVTMRGYFTLMFFDTDGRTNTAEAITHFGTFDPNTIERIRHLKLGTVKKVSEWKKTLSDSYHVAEWRELKRE